MNGIRRTRVVFSGLVALAMAGCASTGMVHSWSDPEYQGKAVGGKTMVIGVAASDVNRRIFEEKFATEIKGEGIDAVPSYQLLPNAKFSEEEVKAKVSESGVERVIVSRVVDKQTVQTVYPSTTYVSGTPYWPGYYGGYYGYYSTAYGVYTDPGYVETTDYVYVETNLYDATNGKLIWTGLSETAMTPGRANELIDGVVNMLMSEYRSAKKKAEKSG